MTASQLAASIVLKARKVESDRLGDVRIARLFIEWTLKNMSVENDDDLSGQARELRHPGPMPYVWMSEAQAGFMAKLMGDKRVDGFTPDHYENAFYFAVKTVNTRNGASKVLYFEGEPECVPVEVKAEAKPVATGCDKANVTAARLINWALTNNRAEKDKYARPDDEYMVAWLAPGMAADLVKELPAESLRGDGTFFTQAAGPFCYWGKRTTASGALLLCWMGEPPAAPFATAKAVQPAKAGVTANRVPADPDIPF